MVDRASGPLLFARYAFPPNHYGYCGPEDADGFFRSGVAGDDHGLRARARNFDGALPHLQLIADAVDIPIRLTFSIGGLWRRTGWGVPYLIR